MSLTDLTVTVERQALLTALAANRDAHHSTYEQAFEGYRRAMRAELEDKLAKIQAGRAVDPYLRHSAPEDHTSDYDDLLDMLVMEVGDTVTVTQSQFRCWSLLIRAPPRRSR